jgi:predicted ATPase
MWRAELSSFVGRTAQVRQLKALVRTTRLVTLIGVGGVGKTRLAARIASDIAPSFPGGVWFVELDPLDQPELVGHAVAMATGAKAEASGSVVQRIAEQLHTGRSLLVLDNCEHVIGAAAELATALSATCPTLSILATSREPLRCAG